MRDLFGNDLTEYELEVIVDSGLARSQWEQIVRSQQSRDNYIDARSFKNQIRKALKLAGVVASALPILTRLTFNHIRRSNQAQKRLRDEQDEPGEDSPLHKFQRLADSVDTSSLLDLPDDDNMSNKGPTAIAPGSGNNGALKETPVDDVRGPISRGPADYQFASLPWFQNGLIAQSAWHYDLSYRMTSPVDPFAQVVTPVDLNAGAGTASSYQPIQSDVRTIGAGHDNTGSSARWYDFYSSMYNYYHVVGARWHMTIENLMPEQLWVHMTHYNDVLPPVAATNEDMLCWKNTESHLIGSHHLAVLNTNGQIMNQEMNANKFNVEGGGTAGQLNNMDNGNMVANRGVSPILQLSGKYSPGQFHRQIHLDSEVENWTAIDANPSLPERILFRFRPVWNAISANDASNYNRALRFRINFRIEYLTEFKELKAQLRWPIERQPLSALVTGATEEDDEEQVQFNV